MFRSRIAVIVVLTMILAACGSDDGEAQPTGSTSDPVPVTEAPSSTIDPPTTTTEGAGMSVSLVDYPAFDTPIMAASPETLDAFAADYVAGLDDDEEPEMGRFLFGTLPTKVFDEIFFGGTTGNAPDLMWVMYLSGYFGGRWLRGEIQEAQPDAPLVQFSSPPDEETFQTGAARAQLALDARNGDDSTVLAYAASSLLDTPAEVGDEPIRGLADSFGYNQGYMLQILEAPPEGLETPERFEVTCEGLLSCDYASPKLAVLADLEPVEESLADDPTYAEVAATLEPIQAAAIPRGRSVWSSGLSVQGFPQVEYDQLLEVSSSFLETVQATALMMARASAESDVDAARTGALAHAIMTVWLDAYSAGLINGEGAIRLPSFN